MNISDKIADWLIKKGLTHAFGVIGSANSGIWNALSQKEGASIICCHGEAAAASASDFFNRTAGGLRSIVLVTAGAGSSNAITGVLASFMDSSPLFVISGQENTPFFATPHPRVLGVQGYGEIEVARSITKSQERLMIADGAFAVATMERLYRRATTGRPGPVWLSIPRNIQSMGVE